MYITIETTFQGTLYRLGTVPGYLFQDAPDVNHGLEFYLDESAYSSFLEVTGTLNSTNYPQSDVTKPISFYLNNKVLVLGTGVSNPSNDTVVNAMVGLTGIIGQELEFFVRKFVFVGEEITEKQYRFNGIAKSLKRTTKGETYDYNLDIEMMEPRFEIINIVDGEVLPKTVFVELAVQGLIFPLTFPITFGNQENILEINNQGNVSTIPEVILTDVMSNVSIVTQLGVFSFTGEVEAGEFVTLDVFNQVATKTTEIGTIDVSEQCSNWEALELEPGINNWNITSSSVNSTTNPSLSKVTVNYFEKVNSL